MGEGENWPIADRRVPGNDPRSLCERIQKAWRIEGALRGKTKSGYTGDQNAALHLGESREVTREQHAKGDASWQVTLFIFFTITCKQLKLSTSEFNSPIPHSTGKLVR